MGLLNFVPYRGCFCVFFLIVPLTVNFLGTYQISPTVANQVSLTSYISTVVSVTLGIGVVFELPVFVYFLTKVGILTPDFMKKKQEIHDRNFAGGFCHHYAS